MAHEVRCFGTLIMALVLGGAKVASPQFSEKTAARDILREVAKSFGFHVKVADFMLEMGIRSLAEFSVLFTTAADVTPFIAKVPELQNPELQRIRVVLAWEGIKKAGADADELAKKTNVEEIRNIRELSQVIFSSTI